MLHLFVLDPHLGIFFKGAKLPLKRVKVRNRVFREEEGPTSREPISECRVIEPRMVELEGVVVSGSLLVPFQNNRKVIRDIRAVSLDSMDPQEGY